MKSQTGVCAIQTNCTFFPIAKRCCGLPNNRHLAVAPPPDGSPTFPLCQKVGHSVPPSEYRVRAQNATKYAECREHSELIESECPTTLRDTLSVYRLPQCPCIVGFTGPRPTPPFPHALHLYRLIDPYNKNEIKLATSLLHRDLPSQSQR